MKTLLILLSFQSASFGACRIVDVLPIIRPKAEWNCGDTYASLRWLDRNQPKPTEQEVFNAVIQCTANKEAERTTKELALQIIRNHASSLEDKVDALIVLLDFDESQISILPLNR